MKNIIFSIVSLFLVNSCTKVIDVNLNEAAPQIVIESALQEGTHQFTVKVTKTGNYFGVFQETPVENATISLKKGDNIAISCQNNGGGNYSINDFKAENSLTYFLSVTIDGKNYEASSFMPKAIEIDTLTVGALDPLVSGPGGGGGNKPDTFQVYCNFYDPLNEDNFYRIKTVLNSVPQNEGSDLLVVDDRLNNGNYSKLPIYTSTYELNDLLEVEFISMDKKMFDYFNTLSLLVGGNGGGAAPTNPNTNWSGGALGYFGAFSSVKKIVLVQ
jgi:hypothetical protein